MARGKKKTKRKSSVRALKAKAERAAAEIEDTFEEPTVDNAPPLPMLNPSEAASKASEAMLKLAREMPNDPLEMQLWGYKVQMASMHEAIVDEKISSSHRRRELRSIAAAAAAIFPDAIRAEAKRMIKEDRQALEARNKTKGGATLEERETSPSPAPIADDFGDAPA